MFWHAFQTIVKTISTKKLNHQWNINIFIHFLTTESQGLMRFPHQYPPPRPRLSLSCTSTVAFASRSRSTTESRPLRAAKCSGVMPQQPQPEAKPQAEPNRTKGRKILRKFRAPQKSKLRKLWPLKNLPWTSETMRFWGCLDDIELVEKGRVNKVCSQNALRRLKKCSVSKKTNMRAIGTQQNFKSVPLQ